MPMKIYYGKSEKFSHGRVYSSSKVLSERRRMKGFSGWIFERGFIRGLSYTLSLKSLND